MKKLFLLCGLVLSGLIVQAQSSRTQVELRWGLEIDMYRAKGRQFAAVRSYLGAIMNQRFSNGFIVNYGPVLSIYNNTLGSLSTPLKFDLQADLVNSFSIGYGNDFRGNPEIPFANESMQAKYIRTMNNHSTYNLVHYYDYALFLTSNLVLNNKGRHQYTESLTITANDFTLNYYNDGGNVMEWIGLSDNLDRYWTGGLGLTFHNYEGYNDLELSFDQFTGFSSLMYKFSTLMGFDVLDYNGAKGESADSRLNSSEYNAKVWLNRNYALDIGVRGSLTRFNSKTGKTTYYGLQDLLHTGFNYALHQNHDNNKLKLGLSTNFMQYAKQY
ncbi:MAG: hypothetical protein ACPF9D_12925 [Owenweeksia sp.]